MTGRRSSRVAAILTFAIVGLIPATAASAADPTVSISDFKFKAAKVTVTAGTVVTWNNTATRKHTVTADDGSFDSGKIGAGEAFGNLFETAGTFAYHCTIHPDMKGRVVVTAAAAASPGGTPEPTPPSGTLPPDFGSPLPTIAPESTTGPQDPSSDSTGTYATILLLVGLAAVFVITLMIANRRRTPPTG